MSLANPSETATLKHPHSPASRVAHVFETILFASRWIQAPLYGGLIMAELLSAYNFLVERWEIIRHIDQ